MKLYQGFIGHWQYFTDPAQHRDRMRDPDQGRMPQPRVLVQDLLVQLIAALGGGWQTLQPE
ncbi:hypothetical protein FBY03_1268 [Pseudomonas sp. SJZ079]|uniref:hypothetical protein n=1 Tax=Pseudomonas sp. SJZ079 TaxID=2572887 RepID=UPI00119B48EA|nr:hypothetical protein [Pseudomonas sp. SJZ079]TWC29949.1 hypothetical protein FBY03_1268 [Pseudomonas sp. SJZ079]